MAKYFLLPRATALILVCVLLTACPGPDPTPTPTPPSSAAPHTGSRTLPIQPVAQQLSEWCWLASAQMIFTFYGVPALNADYQCGEIAAFFGPSSPCWQNCSQCDVSAGSTQNLAYLFQEYPYVVQQFYPSQRVPQVIPAIFNRPLTMYEVQQEIEGGHPVELGITQSGPFTGVPQHAVVLVGYSYPTAGSSFQVIINDPYPYDSTVGPQNDPYLLNGAIEQSPGQYVMDYQVFATNLQWSVSITSIAQ